MTTAKELKTGWGLPAIDLLNRSATPHDYCRRLTLDPLLGVGMRGNHLFLLSSAGTLQLMGGYGQYPYEDTKEFSSFDDSVMAEAINTRRVARRSFDSDFDVQACPALKADVVNGVILSVLEADKGGTQEFQMEHRAEQSYYLSLVLFVSSAGFGPLEQVKRSATNEPLSERQMQILIGIGMGKTNLQIANELILSESSIKQETVKIFRSLGVANRQQAAIKARAMGSIPQEITQN